jgi:hypothetical protein
MNHNYTQGFQSHEAFNCFLLPPEYPDKTVFTAFQLGDLILFILGKESPEE